MKVIIIGAGIGGLTTAIALQQLGHEVIVYEQSSEIKALGAGIVLAANAMTALRKLGIEQKIIQAGRIVSSFEVVDDQGNVLSEVYAHRFFEKYGIGNFTIARYDLHHILASELQQGTIQLGKKLKDFSQNSQSVSVTFEDATQDQADVMIAGDGIHSVVRKKLLPNSRLRYSGYTCWRALVDISDIPCDINKAFEAWGAKGRFGFVPISATHVYYFVCINAPVNDPHYRQYTPADLAKHFANYQFPIPQILSATTINNFMQHDLYDLAPIRRWAFDRILLLGDAAHATTPNMGQGACQAIEDALVLQQILKEEYDWEKVTKHFEQKRIARVTKVVNNSWNVGKLAQLENPLLIKLRNWTMKRTPDRMRDKQYEFLYEIDF